MASRTTEIDVKNVFHGMRAAQRITCLAVSLALPGIGAAATQGTGRDAAIQRAQSQIAEYPGRTLHGPDQSYDVKDVVFDSDGRSHVRFDRRFKGMRVLGGDLVVHSDRNGSFESVSQTLSREPRVKVTALFSPAEAVRAALATHPAYRANGAVERVVYARSEPAQLAYDVLLHGTQFDGTPSELHVIVDAQRGRVLESWDDIHTAPKPGASIGTGVSFFDGTVALPTTKVKSGFELRDPGRGSQYTIDMNNSSSGGSIFVDKDNLWGDGTLTSRQTVAVDAQYGSAVTWDYFRNVHGRNGIANDGAGALNRVHYGTAYNNASWSDSCFCMTYGDGDGTTYNPFVSLDIIGHEMAHGVTSRTAALIYSGESGGLNEATSDIFGTMVEFYANNASDPPDYLIGEKLFKIAAPPGKIAALRSMIRPSVDGHSLDCWVSPGVPGYDVHYSSGIANHFFYLLAAGTTNGNPSPTCQATDGTTATGTGTLAGIGRAKAEKIWYRALTVYMTSSTDYPASRTATLSAAGDLFGAGSLEQTAVAAAWTAVGVY